jgi:hypothetical protein
MAVNVDGTPREDEWLWGWDPTPGIVSVWAEADGRAQVWRRVPGMPGVVHEQVRFRPWVLLASLEDLSHLGSALLPEPENVEPNPLRGLTYRTLTGPGELRYLVSADDGRTLTQALLEGASRRLGGAVRNVRDLGAQAVLQLSPEDQYLTASGRTHFRGLLFDDLRRLQFDLETTGLDPEVDSIFLVAVRGPDGEVELLERGAGERGEADLIWRLCERIRALDPDVIENHNLHGFDLPFLVTRAKKLNVPLTIGRWGPPGLRRRAAQRGVAFEHEPEGKDGPGASATPCRGAS